MQSCSLSEKNTPLDNERHTHKHKHKDRDGNRETIHTIHTHMVVCTARRDSESSEINPRKKKNRRRNTAWFLHIPENGVVFRRRKMLFSCFRHNRSRLVCASALRTHNTVIWPASESRRCASLVMIVCIHLCVCCVCVKSRVAKAAKSIFLAYSSVTYTAKQSHRVCE